ncbi:MAG TPA: ATP-dependent RNA helicase DbpA [Gammaproteobacteria bacterium]|nr:ATP-dependent RNA helicase DbpA [Gammaproteobacteria bacterium]
MSVNSFSSLNLDPALIKNLATLGYESMTPVQAETLPAMLAGEDIIAQSRTGSGKTVAFGLGLLHNLAVKRFRIQSLVLCPTRELADQVAREIRKLARSIHNIKVLTLCGGVPLGPQIGSLEHGAHIIVGTPGRIEDHLNKGTLNLDNVNTLVLDEADRMLEMGFKLALDLIFSLCPAQRQTLLFSATFPDQIQSITDQIMKNPVMVKITTPQTDSDITQHFFRIEHETQRQSALQKILLEFSPESTVVFCNTRLETQALADDLNQQGFDCLPLHGDLEQRDRDQTLVKFANKSTSILIATDVAARGLDIDKLDLVVHYRLSRDPEVHIHRTGRTGRAGNKGIACTLLSENEYYKIEKLEDYLKQSIKTEPLPPYTSKRRFPKPTMVTLLIDGGKKQKIRPGDIVGALTSKAGIAGNEVGKIHVFDHHAYVAIQRDKAKIALQTIAKGKLKGRNFRVRLIHENSRR